LFDAADAISAERYGPLATTWGTAEEEEVVEGVNAVAAVTGVAAGGAEGAALYPGRLGALLYIKVLVEGDAEPYPPYPLPPPPPYPPYA
jgi:hypothetical protein